MHASSIKLAETLRAAGLLNMARSADGDHYNDYFSLLDAPALQLMRDLGTALGASTDPEQKLAIQRIIDRHKNGEFDATENEAKEWSRTPEGKRALKAKAEKED